MEDSTTVRTAAETTDTKADENGTPVDPLRIQLADFRLCDHCAERWARQKLRALADSVRLLTGTWWKGSFSFSLVDEFSDAYVPPPILKLLHHYGTLATAAKSLFAETAEFFDLAPEKFADELTEEKLTF